MKVESLNLKNTYGAQKQPLKSKVNFQGGKVNIAEIEKEINKLNPASLRFINRLRSNISEFQDICINALGTGLLAPIFIKYNPLSKTDEDTRTYSAWRQPVSAVLAVATQGVITIPFTRLINDMANNGWFGESCNKTPFRDTKYFEKAVAADVRYAHLTKEQIAVKAKELEDMYKTKLLETLKKENTIKYQYRGENGTKNMDPENFRKLLLETTDNLLKNEKTQLERFEQEKLPNRIARSEFYRNNADTTKNLLNEISEKLKTIDNDADIEKYLKGKCKELKRAKADKQLINMVNEARTLSSAGKDAVLAKISKMLEHVKKYEKAGSLEEVTRLCTESIQDRVNIHKEAVEFLKKVKEEIGKGKTVSGIEKMFKSKIKKVTNAGRTFSLADKSFSEEVIAQLKKITNSHVDSVKRFSTLAVALATLPATCWLLNWLYPRFMDAVFPNLSNKKHSNEAKDLIEKAPKKAEVK